MIFQRRNFTDLWFTITSNEILGILDSSYLEDYFGTDGQLTLFNTITLQRTPIIMNEVLEETPGIAHDVFTGVLDLTTLLNGAYKLEGRVRDIEGNYTILSEVQTPLGFERVMDFDITITAIEVVVEIGLIKILLGITVDNTMNVNGNLSVFVVKSMNETLSLSKNADLPLLIDNFSEVSTIIRRGMEV
jgi:hypothetical protein